MKGSWRFISSGKNNAFVNMSIDEAILKYYCSNGGQPVIRVYSWESPSLSLGFGQDIREINRKQCKRHGVDIVRRMTGGKAVLHDVELTYSIVASTIEGFPLDIKKTYNLIAKGLIATFKLLGVEINSGFNSRHSHINKICFLTSTPADLLHNGKKIVGSAQIRKGNAFLQHGSIVINHNTSLLFSLFNYPSEIVKKKDMASFDINTVILNDLLKRSIGYREISDVLGKGFEEALQLDILNSCMTNDEKLLQNKIMQEKYMNVN